MKKIFNIFILFLIISIILFLGILSTYGIQTGKFNNLISQKINDNSKNVKTKLNDIKFKLDIKELSLFLETKNPEIVYKNALVPTNNLKVYIDFFSILKTDIKIKKINIIFDQIDIRSLKNLSSSFKPSNLKSFINNKVKSGNINAEVEIFFKKNLIDDFITKGQVTNFQSEIVKNFYLEKSNFSFFADKTDLLIKNFDGVTSFFKIQDGDLKVKLSSKISLEANFETSIKYKKQNNKTPFFFKKDNFSRNLKSLDANLVNQVKIDLDKTYKVKDFNYENNGKIINAIFEDTNLITNEFFNEKINFLSLTNSEIKSGFSSKKKFIKLSGKYSVNKSDFLFYDLENIFENQSLNFKINCDFDRSLNLEIINYQKPKDKNAKIYLDLDKKKMRLRLMNLIIKRVKILFL